MANSDDASARGAARAGWPVARFSLGEEPGDDLSESTSPGQRIAMMWELATTAWRLAGRPLPTYGRDNMPSAIFRPGDVRPDDDQA